MAGTFVRNDYEPPPVLSSDIHLSNQYESVDANSVGFDNKGYQSNGVLPDNEQVYEDPGHVKEKIYVWLERKDIYKLKKSHVRYSCTVHVTFHLFY